MSRHNGKQSIAKIAFALVIVSFLLSTLVSLFSLHLMNERNVREMNRVLTTQVYDYIMGELSGPIMSARTMASNSFLVDTLQNEEQTDDDQFETAMVKYLSSIERSLGFQQSFVVSDASKRYYTRDGLYKTIDLLSDEDAWYAAFVESGSSYDLDVDSDEKNNGDLTVFVNARVEDNKRNLLGVCGIGVRMMGIQDLFRNFEQNYNVKINLVDASGIVQVDTNSDNIGAVNLHDMIAGKKSGEYVYEELDGGKFAMTKYVDAFDWYLIVQSNGPNESNQFVSIILLNVGLCLFVLVALFVALRITRRRTDELTTASLIDHPTSLYNKRAFAHDLAELSTNQADKDLVCVTVDVNGLKTVNDTVGHEAGDELIKGAADCLRSCYGRYGKVYRTGGDEFIALLHVPENEFELLKEELSRTVSSWSGEKVGGLAVSCGYAPAWEFPGESIESLSAISDKRMYEDKDRYYASTGAKRR